MQHEPASSERRIDRLRGRFSGFGVEAVLLLDMTNIRYLTGFTGSDGALLVDGNEATLLVDGRYVTQAKAEAGAAAAVVEYRDKREGIAAAGRRYSAIGFEPEAMNVALHAWLADNLPEVVLKPLSVEITALRAVKDEDEISRIREAAGLSFRGLSAVRDLLRPGMMERDIALELEFRIRRGGADDMAFPAIVASGENSALPHARPGTRRIIDGDIVVIDYGATVKGYCCDETWTFAVGHADEEQRDAYALVKEAHDRAIDAVRSGVSCREIDRIARRCIEDGGLGANFSHGTGHGVGLAVHEAPRVAARSEEILEPGMVITLEPGVYFPGRWGIRIEDTVLVKENGCEVLTKMPKDFTVIQ